MSILFTFVAALTGALIFGYIACRLGVSPMVGYLLAGIAIGPFTPGLVADHAVLEQFAEIGVILLLFGIGLRFQVKELVAVWHVALPGALLQSAISTMATAVLLHFMGWSWTSGMILGMAISVASTVVMALVLAEHRDLHSPIGHIAIGWTVVEDIITVLLLLLLPIVFGKAPDGNQTIGSVLGVAALKIVGLVFLVILLGRRVIPWLLEKIEKTRSAELFTLTILVVAIGIAVGSSVAFGVSMALGAFLAGLAVGRSDFASRAAVDALPMKDVFSVLFFVSIGMLFDPRAFIEEPLLIGIIFAVVVVIKPVVALFVVRVLGKPYSMAIPIGAAFAQIGEFSFILGTVARNLGLLNDSGWNVLVGVSITSIAFNPAFYQWVRRAAMKLNRLDLPEYTAAQSEVDIDRCILVGYGPVGKIVHQLLAERTKHITIIDINLDTVRRLQEHGYSAIYGDVLRQGILEQAGIATAGTLILSAEIDDAAEIVRQARKHNPKIRTFVRCSSLYKAFNLKKVGASVVAAGEVEVGVALAEAVTAENLEDAVSDPERRIALRNRLYEIAEPKAKPRSSARGAGGHGFAAKLSAGMIVTNLKAKTRDDAIEELIDRISSHPRIKDHEELYKRVMEREQIANTYIGHGLALPHARTNTIDGIVVSVAISNKGIDWNAPDDMPVHIIVFIGANESLNQEYLQLLSKMAAVFDDQDFLKAIKQCSNSANFLALVQKREKELMGRKTKKSAAG